MHARCYDRPCLSPHLLEAVDGAVVLDCLAGRHHHPPAHGVNGVGGQASTDGDAPTQQEAGQEVVLQGDITCSSKGSSTKKNQKQNQQALGGC
jgi:hypothetical protein